MWQVIHASEHFRAEHDPSHALIRLTRLPSELAPEQVDVAFAPLVQALEPWAGQRLLIDLRLSRGNNDPLLEAQVRRWLMRLAQLFPRSALVVATAVGQLHVQRMERQAGHDHRNVFFRVEDAEAALMAAPLSAPSD